MVPTRDPHRGPTIDPPVSVRGAIAAALGQFDARVAPAMGERGAELSAAIRALADALRHGSGLATQEALFALRRAMGTLDDEFTDQRTELGALTLAVEYALARDARDAGDAR
jgi:hypothetical protein